ncbi:MAG: bifunctional ornithine acetyltransferase/N-acetylglutamate synthase [Coriobacteriaceae bacterium]|nr:bifunctional ornithine acetyltransferase/N-acetylglutamate synthase [Coriobacteriaceae bacterium]
MTTDTHPKEGALTFGVDGVRYTVGGMCKGSGMMQPNMATMLAVLTTDLPLTPEAARSALESAVGVSFNKVTVDSDTSTNDSVFLLSSGTGGGTPVGLDSPALRPFVAALTELSRDLARQIARDGEGASKLVTVEVSGAATAEDADTAARSVANSPLVKTAIGGHDCNWGRIAAALGKSGAAFSQDKVDIDIMGLSVCRAGLTVPFDEEEAARRFEEDEIVIAIDLHAGQESAELWTCDLTHGYISINADYRT